MIHVNRQQFHTALKLVLPAVMPDRRNSVPVLAQVRATANGVLALEATDLDVHLRAEVPYTGEQGVVMLPAPRVLRQVVAGASGDEVTLAKADNGVLVGAGPLAMELTSRDPADFPDAGHWARDDFSATLGAEVFAQLARLMPAVSTEETRYYLNGIHLTKVGEWTYRGYSTDGHRLFMADIALPDAVGDLPGNVILPRQFLITALAMFRNCAEPVALRIGRMQPSNRREERLDDALLPLPRLRLQGTAAGVAVQATAKLIDGFYPDVRRVIPQAVEYHMEVNRAALLRALASVTPLGEGRVRAVKLIAREGLLKLALVSATLGKVAMTIPADHALPDGWAIGFNGQFLADTLKVLRGDVVVFGLTDSAAATLMEDPADTAFRAVIMPMRV